INRPRDGGAAGSGGATIFAFSAYAPPHAEGEGGDSGEKMLAASSPPPQVETLAAKCKHHGTLANVRDRTSLAYRGHRAGCRARGADSMAQGAGSAELSQRPCCG